MKMLHIYLQHLLALGHSVAAVVGLSEQSRLPFPGALSMMISFPKSFTEQSRAPSWVPSCITEVPLVHSYTEA